MNSGKRRNGITCLMALLGLWACQGSRQKVEPITVDEIAAHIRYLSSDQLEGRAVGTKGIEMAARYHEDYFRTMGLEPGFALDEEPLGAVGARRCVAILVILVNAVA